jgi:UDP-hydrolysing UDP-N-acetyl-D-glucosamine 2-epimerase
MGEDPDTVFNVGCPAVDTLLATPLLSLDEVLAHPLLASKRQGRQLFPPEEGYVLAMYHPVTTEYDHIAQDTMELLSALEELQENVYWVWLNADAGSRKIIRTIDKHLNDASRTRFEFFDHVPVDLFVSLMARAKLMVGNSSAGVREACYFGVPVVNVGMRQFHRERALSVADVPDIDRANLVSAMRAQLEHGPYPVYRVYGNGEAGQAIAAMLAETPLGSTQKFFHMDGDLTSALDEGEAHVRVV